MAWQGQSAWQGRSLWFDRSVSEALTAAFAIAGKPAPKLIVGNDPRGRGTWSYDENEGKFYVPIMPSSTMDDEQEHLFRAAIAHEVAGKEVASVAWEETQHQINLTPAYQFAGVKEGTRGHGKAAMQVGSIAQGLTSAMVDAHVIKRWPGMGRSLRRATEAMVTSAVKRVQKSRKHNSTAASPDHKHPDSAEKFKYSDLALLAGFAAQGGKIRDLLRNVQYDVDVPDDFKQMAEQMASAADAEGLPSSQGDVVPTALRWLRHFDEPPAPPPPPQGGEGEGDGKGKSQPGQGQPGKGKGGGKGNPYDSATTTGDQDHAEGKSSGKQAGDELVAQLAEAGTGRDTTPYSGETKSFPFEESKKHTTRQGYTIKHLAAQQRNDGRRPTPDEQQTEIDAFALHYDRDVGVIGQALRQALRGPTIARQARHQVGRFNPRNAARYLAGNRDVFDRVTYLPGDKVAVSILIDMSGSMSCHTDGGGWQHVGRVAMRAACVLNEALLRMGVPTRMCGYTTHANLAAGIYELSTPQTTRLEFAKRREFLASRVFAVGGTPTLPAMQHELDLLTRRDESQRFLFLLTDGEDGNPHEEHLAAIASAKARGVTTIILAIGGHVPSWNKFKASLGDAAIVIPVPVEQMGPAMARTLVKELMRARMLASRR